MIVVSELNIELHHVEDLIVHQHLMVSTLKHSLLSLVQLLKTSRHDLEPIMVFIVKYMWVLISLKVWHNIID